MNEIDLKKRTITEMMTYFNGTLAEMDIPMKDKITIGGMLIALGYRAQKAADVAEVVRCKDCKWYKEGRLLPPNKFCYRLKDNNGKSIGYNFSEMDYCSYGERKEG